MIIETINQLYERLGLYKWWQDEITNPNAVYNNLGDIKMNNKERTRIFLEKIATMCDNEASSMLEDGIKTKDIEEPIAALVHSSTIMSVFTMCKLTIDKLDKIKD